LSNTLSLCSSLNVRDQLSHLYWTTGKIIVFYILLLWSIGECSWLQIQKLWLWDVENRTLSKTVGSQLMVILSTLGTGRPLFPGNIIFLLLVLIYVRGWVNCRA
jgi:hypothetical protein